MPNQPKEELTQYTAGFRNRSKPKAKAPRPIHEMTDEELQICALVNPKGDANLRAAVKEAKEQHLANLFSNMMKAPQPQGDK